MKLGLGLSLQKHRVLSGFDSATQALLDYGTSQAYTLPSESYQDKINTLIVALKSAGIWDKLDILYLLATDGDRDFAKINIVNPGTFNCTEIGTPTFTSQQGFTGSGSAALSTGWNSFADGINSSRNDQSLFSWVYSTPPSHTVNQVSIGSNSTGTAFGGTYITCRANQFDGPGNRIRARLNTTSETLFANAAFAGLYHIDRSASSNYQFYANGVLDGNTGASSNADNDADLYICALNDSGVSSRTLVPISIAGSGASLGSEKTDLYNAFNTYMQ